MSLKPYKTLDGLFLEPSVTDRSTGPDSGHMTMTRYDSIFLHSTRSDSNLGPRPVLTRYPCISTTFVTVVKL